MPLCKLNVAESKAGKELARQLGTNKAMLVNYLLAIQNENPRVGKTFDEWYKDKYHSIPNLDDGRKTKTMVRAIKEYYDYTHGSVSAGAVTSKSVDVATLKGYTNTDSRNEGLHAACSFIRIAQSQDLIDDKINISGKKEDYIRVKLREFVTDKMASRICLNRNIDPSNDDQYEEVYDEMMDAYDEGIDSFIDFINEEFKDSTDQNKNFAAMAFEILDDTTVSNYIDEMIASDVEMGKLLKRIHETKEEKATKEDNLNGNEESTEEDTETQSEDNSEPSEVETDRSIANANNHIGVYTDYKLHVSDTIRTFLGAIYKLNSATPKDAQGRYDYDTNNSLGLPTLMDANQLMTVLYSCVDYTNANTMLDSIKRISEQQPGMECLIQVVDKLVEDKDLLQDFYRTFGKNIVTKLETVISSDGIHTRVSNRRADRRTSLYFEYYNSTKRTSINLSREVGEEISKDIRDLKETRNKALSANNKEMVDSKTAQILDKLTYALKRHCPTIDTLTVANYLQNHPIEGEIQVDKFNTNLNNLLAIIDDLNKQASSSRKIYEKKVEEVATARKLNKEIKAKGHYNQNQLYDETAAYKTEYATDMEAPTQRLADALLNYTVVRTELNSRNVHGNLSSDVINSSMITNIMKTLQNEVALKNFGKYKSLTDQYNLSNILVEKRDADGNIINLGLFTVKNGEFTPTYYGKDLLKVRLFNGAGDENSGNNVLYSEMSKGDYIATAISNFFDDNKNTNGEHIEKIALGSYFMKVPSDAPKNFCISAPRYSTGTTGTTGLFNFEDNTIPSQVSDFITKALSVRTQDRRLNGTQYVETRRKQITQLPSMLQFEAETILDKVSKSREEINKRLFDKEKSQNLASVLQHTPIRDIDQVCDAIINLTGKDEDIVTIRSGQYKMYPTRKYVEGTESLQKIAYRYVADNGEEYFYYVEGKLIERNGVEQLQNAKFAGFLQYDEKDLNSIPSDFKNVLRSKVTENWIKSGKAKRVVNTNHPIFQQLRNSFIQELTDMGTALNTFFYTDPHGNITSFGSVNTQLDENNKSQFSFREGFDNSEECGRKLYKLYHVGSSGTIMEFDKSTGRYKLTGNVFKSDRFNFTYRKDTIDSDGTIHKAGDTINYGQEILDRAFDLLYGGGQDTYIHMDTDKSTGRRVAVPTEAQMQVINEQLSKFLENYISDSINRIDEVVSSYDGLTDFYTDVDHVTEFAANYFNTYVAFNDIFEGDSKFYRGSQDILKRAKEVQGSGVPYGTFDITRPLIGSAETATTDDRGVLLDSSILNDAETVFEIKDADGNIIGTKHIEHYSKFRGVTITNTKLTGPTIGDLKKVNGKWQFKEGKIGALSNKLIKVLIKQGYTTEEATSKAADMMGGYTGTKVNDAQSYITFDEWVRRITARGQFNKYKPLIDKILDESQELNLNDITEFVQVQKNFYYDQHYNKELNVIAPRQIKNAEFVLVPRFIRGTELERVAELMEKHHIDQLNTEETSKAGKCKVLTLWNNDGVLDEKNVQDFEENVDNPGFTEYFDYNYLYTQSETPQHMDATNKAGIQIMKKIVDNIPPQFDKHGNPTGLYAKKLQFFDLYSQNIQDNFEDLMDEFGIQIDNDGNIVLENGEIPNIDYDIFFERMEDEFRRQGLDSNMRAYITQKEKGSKDTEMPLDMGSFSAKVESVSQSIFNSRITRQTLPGYHAAQITNVGWHALSETVGARSYSKDLKYHPDGKPYVEIMLPKSAFNFSEEMLALSDEELLAQLQKEGLDTSIGYRIPTEGKQSVCVFKLVGFTNAAMGSTIIVPNDWVAQTGSDFDIDSVYGIMPQYYHTNDGVVHKVNYKDNPDLYDWYRYINRLAHKKENFKIKKLVDGINKSVQETLDSNMDIYKVEEHDYYQKLHGDLKEEIKEVLAEIKERKTATNHQENYLEMLDSEMKVATEWLEDNREDLRDDEIENVENFIKACNKIEFHINNAKNLFDEEKRERVNYEISKIKDKFTRIASENGLQTYEEFVKNPVAANTREQRNNKILDIMTDILSDDASLEENLSRSNFDDISDAKKECYAGTLAEKLRQNRSTYNVLDQADYQEDAMSGAKLKAFSVTRDTFTSVCNTVRPYLGVNHQVKIAYALNESLYTRLQQAYNDNMDNPHVAKTSSKMYVLHDRLGWSNTNHNVVDKILTAYDSQTTAYILDAIKEGAIPNVNDSTFGVYKLFTDIGSSHLASVAFMMQPGIERIVKNYNANKSIYQSGNNNHIHTAIKQIARDLGITIKGELVSEKTGIDEVIKALNNNQFIVDRFIKLFDDDRSHAPFSFSLDDTKKLSRMSIDVTKLLDRIKDNTTTPVKRIGEDMTEDDVKNVDKLLHDLFVVLQYNKLLKLSDRITLHARVSNPDKFGAKQSIYATRKIFKDIRRLLTLENNDPTLIGYDKDETPKSFIDAVYPGIREGLDDYMTKDFGPSAYPPLNTFLKRATATSIKINKTLFLTQSDDFIANIENVETVFTHKDDSATLSEKIYNKYKSYTLAKIYNDVPVIQHPIAFAKDENGIYTYGIGEGSVEDERSRISGYGHSVKTDLHVDDINNPTEEELKAFAVYTPAQKVSWIQSTFSDKGIFNYISINMTNRNNSSLQQMEFDEDMISPENAYTMFRQAFNNTNPFVKLAAYDLIKYAFSVEGFKMKSKGIGKTVTNDTLAQDKTAGTSLVDFVISSIKNSDNRIQGLNFAENLRNFVRANTSMSGISTKVNDRSEGSYDLTYYDSDFIIVPKETATTSSDGTSLIEKYDLGYRESDGSVSYNSYVKLKKDKRQKATLYEIIDKGDSNLYLVPLNKLEEYENSELSTNTENNIYPKRDYYIGIINAIQDDIIAHGKDAKLEEVIEAQAKNREDYMFKEPTVETDRTAKEFSVDDPAILEALQKAIDNFNDPNGESTCYIVSNPLSRYITTEGVMDAKTGEIFCAIKELQIGDTLKTFKIVKASTNGYYRMLNGKDEINTGNKSLDNILKTFKGHPTLFHNLYYVEEFKPVSEEQLTKKETRESSMSEQLVTNGIRGMIGKNTDDDLVGRTIQRLESKDIHASHNKNTVGAHLSDALQINAEYVTSAVDKIMTDCNAFCKDEEGVYHSVDDKYTIDLIKNDKVSRERYIKLCNDARALVKNYNTINNIDIEAEDEVDRKNLRIIQSKINALSNNILINKAETIFTNEFLAKLSTNPLVKSDIISLLDGYHSASFFDCYIGDLQHTSNPLIQIVTKEAMADIRGKEMLAKKTREIFTDTVQRIMKDAAAHGQTIDMKKIVDDEGRFIQSYASSLIDDMHEMQKKCNEARNVYGENSNEYQLAKLEYDQWKLDYIHQPAPDAYYKKDIELRREMLKDPDNPNAGFETIYLKYMELQARRNEALSHRTADGVLDERYREELRIINREVDNLCSGNILTDEGIFIPKDDRETIAEKYGEDSLEYLNPGASAKLVNYLKEKKKNKETYFDRTTKFGFEEELTRNLAILNEYPKDDNGNYITPERILMQDEKFKKAKEWVDNNATLIIPQSIGDAVKKAYETFKTKKTMSKLSQLAKDRDAYDADGAIDATKFSKEDIEEIYKAQAERYQYDFNPIRGDMNLMTAANRGSVVYTDEFYKSISRTDRDYNPQWIATVNKINDILKTVYSPTTGIISTSDLSLEDLKKLNSLYDDLAECRKYTEVDDDGNRSSNFFKENVEAVYDYVTFNREEAFAKAKYGENSLEFIAWTKANTELLKDREGNYILDDEGHRQRKPNHFLYGYIQPKGAYNIEDLRDNALTSTLNDVISNTSQSSIFDVVARGIRYTNTELISLVNLPTLGDENYNDALKESVSQVSKRIKEMYPNIGKTQANSIIADTLLAYYVTHDSTGFGQTNNGRENNIATGNTIDEFREGTIDNIHDLYSEYLDNFENDTTSEFIDKDKTAALKALKENTEKVKTQYYYDKLAEMRRKTKEEYNEWYKANHIYNPYRHTMEPLDCWTKTQYKYTPATNELRPDYYAPKWNQTEGDVAERFKPKDRNGNYYYKAGYGNAFNYKDHDPNDNDIDPEYPEDLITGDTPKTYSRKDNKYDNPVKLNSYEQQLRDYMQNTLLQLGQTSKSRKYFEKGYLPMRAKAAKHDAKYWGKQAAEFIGWQRTHSGNDVWYEDENIDYSRDREITMPMLDRLGQRSLISVPAKMKDETQEEYDEKVKQINEENEKIQEKNDKIKNELLDNDWIGAIEEFITQAGHYNAVQDNKQLLFFAKNMLDRSQVFDKKIGQSSLHRNEADSTEDNPVYVKKEDKYLQDQYTNWLRRLLYDQYREPNGWLTRAGNIMQSLTSSKFMMMNITGGISNVTLGFNQIMGEAFAKEYFGKKDWFKAHQTYSTGLTDYMANMYSEKSSTLSGALIKMFNVVEFDEIRGIVSGTLDAGTALDRFRDLMFSPQTMGEHYMQNTTMFAMMDSHRLIPNNDPNIQRENIAGLPKYKIMNESEYVAQALEGKIKEIIGADRYAKFVEFKKSITQDPNITKDYAWFKKDPITEFVKTNLTKEEKQQYVESKKQITKECKEEFAKAPKLNEQFKFDAKHGSATFADDSIMSQMPSEESYKLLGEFRSRVISVNKKIHGVYDKLGGAKMESAWWGSLVMQYHKHLYPGIMKRYRRKGYWNEERGTVEKGMFWSLIDFASTPLDETIAEYQKLEDGEKTALKGVQMFMKHSLDFISHINLNWSILPDYERANIKRNLGDMLGWASAIVAAIALRGLGDDDDDDKFYNVGYNLALYSADRLASESFMYNPIGLVSEARTLWSSPLACQSEITDLVTALGEIAEWLYQGEDYDGTYKTGLYAGENKFAVRLRRQIPVYRAIERLWNLDKSNHYYKIGTTGTGIVPIKDIADAIFK